MLPADAKIGAVKASGISDIQLEASFAATFSELRNLSVNVSAGDVPSIRRAKHLLDGGTYELTRATLPVDQRRAHGIFFSSSYIAREVSKRVATHAQLSLPACDPTCGAGDLLLAYANLLPLEKTLVSTLEAWGDILYGFDIVPSFVKLAKYRLVLLASRRGNFDAKIRKPERYFPNIKSGNFLNVGAVPASVKVILANPPFSLVSLPTSVDWGSGRSTAAAVFIDQLVAAYVEDREIVAVLPEVLRCGARYAKWRTHIRSKFESIAQQRLGLFDRWTDVDVFLWHLKIKPGSTPGRSIESTKTASGDPERNLIRVGPVVDYRSKRQGPRVPYLEVASAPREEAVSAHVLRRRRFDGTLFRPPFVVVRRTSRPNDQKRAVTTIVTGKLKVAVENHLIVIKPATGSLDDCKKLVKFLASGAVNSALNRSMRCRHLTVGSLRKLGL